jgi:hypothetical protein
MGKERECVSKILPFLSSLFAHFPFFFSSIRGICRRVVVYDFVNVRKRDFDNLAVGAFHLERGRCQGLRSSHAADDAAHMLAVERDYLYVVFAIERLEGCEGFGYFHLIPYFLFQLFKTLKIPFQNSRAKMLQLFASFSISFLCAFARN